MTVERQVKHITILGSRNHIGYQTYHFHCKNSVSQWLNRLAKNESKARKFCESELNINDSTALLLGLCRSFSFLILNTVGWTRWRGISPSQGLYLQTGQFEQTSMPGVGFKPTITAFERTKTVHGLYPVANVNDVITNCLVY
jgi:hypothetical protein